MINLRYHIVSLVSVFLALGLGVIAGTTVINQDVVKVLRSQRQTLVNNKTQLETQNDALKRELTLWQTFGTTLEPTLTRSKLRGRKVTLLVGDGVSGDVVGAAGDVIAQAGGTTAGRVVFSSKWSLPDDATTEQLALAAKSSATKPADVLTNVATSLAARLVAPGDPAIDGDLLHDLGRAGFVALQDAQAGAFPPSGSLFVVLWSGASGAAPPDVGFELPLLRSLAGPAFVAVAEPLASADSLADHVRGDGDLRLKVSTVDHVDTTPGLIALVDELHDLTLGLPAEHYGVGHHVQGVVPSPSP